MGLMYIASSLRKAGHEVLIHDCIEDGNDFKPLTGLITAFRPDYAGVSVIASEQPQAKRVTEVIRLARPGITVIFGGPWPTANPQKAILEAGADIVVIGEGEIAMPELIDAIENGRPATSVSGTAIIENGKVVANPRQFLTSEQLDSLPFPAWDLIKPEHYNTRPSQSSVGRRPYVTVVTSRGCPFQCAYCHQTLGKRFRSRSPSSVLSEMVELKRMFGAVDFEVIDDCFNLDRDRMVEILEQIPEQVGKVRLHFPSGLRSDRLQPGDMALFKKAGTSSAFFAIETASPRIQKLIDKNLDIPRAVQTIREAVDQGIYSTGLFMLGFPTETYPEAYSTVKLAADLPLHRAFFMLVTPFAGTKLADMSSDVLSTRNINIDLENLNFYNHSINVSAMTDDELRKVFRSSYKRFYLNPSRIIRLILKHPDKLSLPYYGLSAFVKMLRKSI